MVHSGQLAAYQEDNGRWRVYQHSVHARKDEVAKARTRASSKADSTAHVDELQDEIRDLYTRLGWAQAKAQLTEQAESTVRDQLQRERDRADRLEAQLDYYRRPWWQRIFGGGPADQ